MNSRPRQATIAAPAAAALLGFPAAASGAIDYSKNAATGDVPDQTPKVEIVTVAEDGGFAWGDAAVGAGVALALGLIAYVTTTAIRRRRIASPAT